MLFSADFEGSLARKMNNDEDEEGGGDGGPGVLPLPVVVNNSSDEKSVDVKNAPSQQRPTSYPESSVGFIPKTLKIRILPRDATWVDDLIFHNEDRERNFTNTMGSYSVFFHGIKSGSVHMERCKKMWPGVENGKCAPELADPLGKLLWK